jgi:hypothetical protein
MRAGQGLPLRTLLSTAALRKPDGNDHRRPRWRLLTGNRRPRTRRTFSRKRTIRKIQGQTPLRS